jgi:hypothetical protein
MENTGITSRKEKEERSDRTESKEHSEERVYTKQGYPKQQGPGGALCAASSLRQSWSRHMSLVENSSALSLERFIVCDATLRRNPA